VLAKRGPCTTCASYLVAEYLDNEDFEAFLKREGAFELRRAVDLVLLLCEAPALVHERDMVHRDPTPFPLPAPLHRDHQNRSIVITKIAPS